MSRGGHVVTKSVCLCDSCVTFVCFRIHDLDSMEEILNVQAHDSDILCLEFSKPDTGENLSRHSVEAHR